MNRRATFLMALCILTACEGGHVEVVPFDSDANIVNEFEIADVVVKEYVISGSNTANFCNFPTVALNMATWSIRKWCDTNTENDRLALELVGYDYLAANNNGPTQQVHVGEYDDIAYVYNGPLSNPTTWIIVLVRLGDTVYEYNRAYK